LTPGIRIVERTRTDGEIVKRRNDSLPSRTWRRVLRTGGLLLLATLARAQPPASVVPTATPLQARLATPAAADEATSRPATEDAAAVIPPLSIDESCRLLNEALRLIGGGSPLVTPARAERTARILRAVGAYVERVDRAYPTLPQYAWRPVAGKKVNQTGWETLSYSLKKPLAGVTALALQTHHGDVEIKTLVAIDRDKTKWEFKRSIYVTDDQPRPEICFLPLPTRLQRVEIECRAADAGAPRRPRLFVEAGICALPESAKEAGHHLGVASALLKNHAWDEAATHIRRACELLRDYQRSRRL
jgi:hypothetical protein